MFDDTINASEQTTVAELDGIMLLENLILAYDGLGHLLTAGDVYPKDKTTCGYFILEALNEKLRAIHDRLLHEQSDLLKAVKA